MTIWNLLMPLEYFLLAALVFYLIQLERRAHFLKKQEKRIERARKLPRPAEELIKNSTISE